VQDEWRGKCEALRAAFQYKNLAQPVAVRKLRLFTENRRFPAYPGSKNTLPVPLPFMCNMGLEQRKQIYSLRPPDVGTFMHAVIEKFSRMVANGIFHGEIWTVTV